MSGQLVRITAPHFCADVVLDGDRVVRTAPILHRTMMGLTAAELRAVCAERGWRATIPYRRNPALLEV